MEAVIAVALVCASLLAFDYLVKTRNQPNPPRWIMRDIILQPLLACDMASLMIGGAFLADFLLTFGTPPVTVVDVLLVVLILAGTAVGFRALRRRPPPDRPEPGGRGAEPAG